ncbi:hypothetical protein [Saccharothrix texasensis]|uniref:Uncharacterized protein n=1 Tax=Saccharothrix texasensis TaxID=103734 RepID=A0A3N1H9Z6_9PSEU|nr:hypothetical protein [Saccharothrix texasensis]ROP39102.1 hypothetical protein EDD40_4476 [Saccharothrix texasensis]
MISTKAYPDGLTEDAVDALLSQVSRVSQEIVTSAEPTSALLDGTARERRNRRIAARALRGITAEFGVTLAQVVAEQGRAVRLVRAAAVRPARAVEALGQVA